MAKRAIQPLPSQEIWTDVNANTVYNFMMTGSYVQSLQVKVMCAFFDDIKIALKVCEHKYTPPLAFNAWVLLSVKH